MKFGIRTIATIALATLVASCGLFESDQKNKNKANPETLFGGDPDDTTVDEQSGETTVNQTGLSLAEAFMTYVHPVVKANCSGCHIHTDAGTLPFAAESQDLVIPVASRLIGTKLTEARFYLKVSNKDLPHPDRVTSERVLPELTKALENFFAAVTTLSAGIYTESVPIANAKKQLPKINPTGWLIMEAEGATVEPDTKFKTVLGVHSNGKAVGSTGVPSHPVSGLGRAFQAITYSGEGCANSQVRIDQADHVDNGEGIAKYVVGISIGVKNSAGENVVIDGDRVFDTDIFRILPYGKAAGTTTDEDYKSFREPSFSSYTTTTDSTTGAVTATYGDPNSNAYITFSDTDIQSFINIVRGIRADFPAFEYDRFLFGVPDWCEQALINREANPTAYAANYHEAHVDRLCYFDNGNATIKADAEAGGIWADIEANKLNVLKYIEISAGIRATGATNLTQINWNANADNAPFLYSIGTNHEFANTVALDPVARAGRSNRVNKPNSAVHPNETNINLDWFEPSEKVPGVARFEFSVPEDLHFADLPDDEPIPFRQYYRSSGNLRYRVKTLPDGPYVTVLGNGNADTSTCAPLADGEAWTHRGPVSIEDENAGRRAQLVNLERGKSYSIEFLQVDQDSIIDAFILVANTELNEHLVANPNTEPTVLRQKFYGKGDDGVQRQTYSMHWKTDFGKFTMELIDADGYYALENPIFYTNIANRGKNITVKGFDFIVNGNLSLTDRSFDIDAVRPPGYNAAFGQVLIPKDKGFDQDELGIVFQRLDVSSEEAELPNYIEGPPLEGVECLAHDVFNDILWPVYRQQQLVIRGEYRDWLESAYPGEYDPGDIDNAPEVSLSDFPETYTCTTCHNQEHPFLQLNADDYLESCNKVIARTNLVRPELSFSLRGLRGQFNHPDLFYTLLDPFDGENLKKKTLSSGGQMIFGQMLGPFGTNTETDVNQTAATCTDDGLCRALAQPKRIGFDRDEVYNIPLFDGTSFSYSPITPLDERYGDNNFSTIQRNAINGILPGQEGYVDAMIERHKAQHEAVVQKWVDFSFKRWVEAENAARGN